MKIIYAISGAITGMVIIIFLFYVVTEIYVAWHGDRSVMGAFSLPMTIFLLAGIIGGAKAGIEIFDLKDNN